MQYRRAKQGGEMIEFFPTARMNDRLLPKVEELAVNGLSFEEILFLQVGLYPIHLAAKNGHDEIIRCLLLAGCAVDTKNRDGVPAEIISLAQGHTQIGGLLIRVPVR